VTRLRIKVVPSSSKDVIAEWLDDTLKVRVRAPAEKGRANAAVVKLLKRTLALPKGGVRILSGKTSGWKVVEIPDLSESEVAERLSEIPPG